MVEELDSFSDEGKKNTAEDTTINKTAESRTVDEVIDGMTLFDDELMSKVFDENIGASEFLLRTILNKSDLVVKSVQTQHTIKNSLIKGRDVRLDIFAYDSMGKYYDVEVQRQKKGANIRRARFNSSMLDTRMLKEGQDFAELRDSYVIFIAETDVFGHGIPIYTIDRQFKEITDPYDDGSHIVYINGSYKGEDAIGRLLHDFRCAESKNCYNWQFASGIRYYKEDEEGRKIMSDAVREYAEKYAEEYAEKEREEERINTLCESVKKMVTNLKIGVEQAMDTLEISEKDRTLIRQRL